MNRRQFVQRSLVGGTFTALSRWSSLGDDSSTKPRIPIGFLGASYSHGPDKIRIASTSPDWDFVGVCDPTPAGRQACAELGAKLVSQEELFQRSQVVAVESDIPDHAPHALLALRAGKHIHLEKPPALTGVEIQSVVALAREKKLLVQTGFMWRYHPGFRAIFDAVHQGWLGQVFLVRGYISNHLESERRAEWAKFGGGAMFELGSHLIDATVRLLGKPKAVTPILHRHGPIDDGLKDNNVAVLEYEHATAVIVNTALQAAGAPSRSFEVQGSNGVATLHPIEPPTLTIDLAQPAGPYQKGLQKIAMPAFRRYVGDFAELAAAVRGECPLTASLDDELLVGETVLRAGGMM